MEKFRSRTKDLFFFEFNCECDKLVADVSPCEKFVFSSKKTYCTRLSNVQVRKSLSRVTLFYYSELEEIKKKSGIAFCMADERQAEGLGGIYDDHYAKF